MLTFLTIVLVFGLLVIFHEFGHFIIARWMGVRVLSFSIGFGPVVFARHSGGTEYAVRLLPLGGFVRMLGDDPMGQLDGEAEDPAAFHNKAVWRRMLIIAAGPIFNFILALLVLFGMALVYEGQLISTRVGTAVAGGPAAKAGLRSGDRVRSIGGVAVRSFDEMRREISKRPGQQTPFVIDRDGQTLTVAVTPRTFINPWAAEVGLVERTGQAMIFSGEPVATIAVEPDSPAWKAGLRPGDRIRSVAGTAVTTLPQLVKAVNAANGPIALTWTPARLAGSTPKGELRRAFQNAHAGPTRTATVAMDASASDKWAALGLRDGQRLVGPVVQGGPEDKDVGLRPTDELLALDGTPLLSLTDYDDRMMAAHDAVVTDPGYPSWKPEERLRRLRAALQPHNLLIRHVIREDERAQLADVVAHKKPAASPTEQWLVAQANAEQLLARGWFDRAGRVQVQVALNRDDRVENSNDVLTLVDSAEPEMIANPEPLAHALRSTGEKFLFGSTYILITVREMFKGNVSVKEVGGPIRMAQMTSEAVDRGLRDLLHLLVGLSINLGIVNLLPVPLLDGGHLLFLTIEAVRREPASLRVRQYAAYVGLTLIGLLFLIVMKNDTQRLIASWFAP